VKTQVVCLLLASSMFAQREGNFAIRFEPKAILQTEAQIPFEIHVTNDLRQPVREAKVTLRIARKDHETQVFKAPEVTKGVYLAKPVFKDAGEWSVTVEVHRNDQVTTRTSEYSVQK
jgi:YtkA-like